MLQKLPEVIDVTENPDQREKRFKYLEQRIFFSRRQTLGNVTNEKAKKKLICERNS